MTYDEDSSQLRLPEGSTPRLPDGHSNRTNRRIRDPVALNAVGSRLRLPYDREVPQIAVWFRPDAYHLARLCAVAVAADGDTPRINDGRVVRLAVVIPRGRREHNRYVLSGVQRPVGRLACLQRQRIARRRHNH
jgi:hypothetical protein